MIYNLNINYKRHRLLKHLTLKHLSYWQKPNGTSIDYLTFSELKEKLGWSIMQLEIVYLSLELEGELEQKVNNLENCLRITNKGVSSYSKNQYLNIFYKNIFSFLKELVTISITLGSLFIAYKALNFKEKVSTKQDDTMQYKAQEELVSIKELLNELSIKVENNQKTNTKLMSNDSLHHNIRNNP